jgi:hypothetical protein
MRRPDGRLLELLIAAANSQKLLEAAYPAYTIKLLRDNHPWIYVNQQFVVHN